MKFCNNCGKQIDDNAIFCSHCGTRVNGDGASYGSRGTFNPYEPFSPYRSYPVYDQRESMLIAAISFMSWQIGLILWLIFKRSRPGLSRSASKGLCASGSVGLPILGGVLWMIWRNDAQMRDYAKIAGISAIIGAIAYAFLIASVLFLGVTEILPESGAAGGDILAFISGYFR